MRTSIDKLTSSTASAEGAGRAAAKAKEARKIKIVLNCISASFPLKSDGDGCG